MELAVADWEEGEAWEDSGKHRLGSTGAEGAMDLSSVEIGFLAAQPS